MTTTDVSLPDIASREETASSDAAPEATVTMSSAAEARRRHAAGTQRPVRPGHRQHVGGERPAGGPVPGPGDLLAAVQRAGAAARPRTRRAAAGAGPLPGHLRQQPGRVLHGPGRRAQAPDRHRPGRALGLRARAARGARADLPGRPRADGHAGRGLQGATSPGAGRGGHHHRPLGRARRRPSRSAAASMFREPRLPGADPAGRRPGAPVPLHLRALAQPRRRRWSTPRPATSTSPGSRCRRCCRGFVAHRGPGPAERVDPVATCTSTRFVPLEDVIAAHLDSSSPAWRCASTSPSGSPATRTSRSRRTTPRTSSPPWRRS